MKKYLLIIILLLIFSINFQPQSLAANNPLLEFGQINISSDGQNPGGGSVYLKVFGQNKIFNNSQIINQNGNYIWQGNVIFDDGTSPEAGQEHIAAIEKQIGGVGYYAVTSKIISNNDINNNGAEFSSTRLTKMYSLIGMSDVGKIILTIADIETAHSDDNLWGYRVYRQVDGGPYDFFKDVATQDAQLFVDDFVFTNHAYRYKYKILTKNKEYEGQYFSQESASFAPYTIGNGELINIIAPTISSISHTYGSVDGGLYLTLTGSNFDGCLVIVDGQLVTLGQQNDIVKLFTPPHSSGIVNVRVQKINGLFDEVTFNYLNNPTINVCTPESGTVMGGTIVEIEGNNLYQGITPNVTIGNKIATIQGQPTDGKITIVTPEHSVGKVAVRVDLGNKVEGVKEEIYEYMYPELPQGKPRIAYIIPWQGPIKTKVVIMGTNFSNPKVYFGSQEAQITSASSDYLFVTAPRNVPGPVDVRVVNDNGHGDQVTRANGFTYTTEPKIPIETYPIIQNIYPQKGVSGDIMVISGLFLSEGLEPVVLFGVTENNTNKLSLAKVLNYTDLSVVVNVPFNPTTQNVVNVFLIRADDGHSGISPVQFTYLSPTQNPVPTENLQPVITNIDPETGNAMDVLVISGTNLSNGAKPEVFFGITPNIGVGSSKAEVTHYSDQIVVVKVPNKPSTEKTVDVYLKRNDGSVSKSPKKFTYNDGIVTLGTLDIQNVLIDGIAIRNNDYVNKTLNSAVVYIDFSNSSIPSSGNAIITVNGTSISASFNVPVTMNNKLVASANITGTALLQFSNSLQEGKNNISVVAISNNGEKTSTDNYSLYVASDDDEIKLLPLPDGNLLLNYPNPFNPNGGETTDIAFVSNKEGTLDIYMYDIKGTLIFKRDIDIHAGYNTYTWNGRSDFGDICGTGAYFYRMVDAKRVLGTAKLTIINK